MTDQQKSDLLKLFPGADGKPVHTLREFADEVGDIEDPFEKGDEKFTEVASRDQAADSGRGRSYPRRGLVARRLIV